jgi:ADP-ribose pyrophosphatase
MAAGGFRTVGTESLLTTQFLSVTRRSIIGPDGDTAEREIVHHPGSVALVPLLDDNIVLLSMYRAPADRVLLEIPAGKRDVPGEPPEETARRECVEEIGYRPGVLTPLVEFFNSPGYTDEYTRVYRAEDLTPVTQQPTSLEERAAEIVVLSRDEAAEAIRSGMIVDAKTIIGLATLGIGPLR